MISVGLYNLLYMFSVQIMQFFYNGLVTLSYIIDIVFFSNAHNYRNIFLADCLYETLCIFLFYIKFHFHLSNFNAFISIHNLRSHHYSHVAQRNVKAYTSIHTSLQIYIYIFRMYTNARIHRNLTNTNNYHITIVSILFYSILYSMKK